MCVHCKKDVYSEEKKSENSDSCLLNNCITKFRFFNNLEILIVNNEKKWQQRMVNAPYFFGERAIFFKSVFIHFF